MFSNFLLYLFLQTLPIFIALMMLLRIFLTNLDNHFTISKFKINHSALYVGMSLIKFLQNLLTTKHSTNSTAYINQGKIFLSDQRLRLHALIHK